MTLTLDHFHGSSAPIGRFDPRWKLAALLLAALAAALLQTFAASCAALLLTMVLVLLGGIPGRWYGRRMTTLLLVLAPFVVWLPWLVPGDGWDMGLLHLSFAGLALAALIVVKAFAIVTLMLVLWTTAPPDSTLKAAHALHVPGLLIQLIVLTYRYVFLLGEELGRLRVALRVRGYRNRPSLHSYRTVGHVTAALVIRSYERAERVGQAMRCRGFDGRFRSLAESHTRPADVAGFCAIVLAAAGLLTWDLFSRIRN
jgi:cobalt/nickel transport system permease protein